MCRGVSFVAHGPLALCIAVIAGRLGQTGRWILKRFLMDNSLPLAALASIGLTGCAQPKSYYGVSLTAPVSEAEQARLAAVLAEGWEGSGACRWQPAGSLGWTAVPCDAVPLTALARLAEQNNKSAQLELGIRFEEGIGVPKDIKQARKLYRMAARDSISGQPIGFQDYSGTLLGGANGGENPADDPRFARGLALGWQSKRGLPEARERLRQLPD